jgi:Antibiotic biosynthesis monooxygenase
MFITMNRFRVKRGSEEAFEQVWLSRDTQLTKVPGFVEFHLLKGPEHEEYTPHTLYGRARRRSKPGPSRKHSVLPIGTPARTSRSTLTIRSSKASRSARRCVATKMRSRRAVANRRGPHLPADGLDQFGDRYAIRAAKHLDQAGQTAGVNADRAAVAREACYAGPCRSPCAADRGQFRTAAAATAAEPSAPGAGTI